MRAIERCRTAALGGHRDHCPGCSQDLGISYNSCRNRHCPKCQAMARNQWTARRIADLVPLATSTCVHCPTPTLGPDAAKQTPAVRAFVSRQCETLMQVAANPRHLGAEIGFLACSTPGVRRWSTIRTFTTSSRRADSPRTAPPGFDRRPLLPSRQVLSRVFRASSSTRSRFCTGAANSNSTDRSSLCGAARIR